MDLLAVATNSPTDPNWVRVVVPLGAALLGAIIGSLSSIGVEIFRDRRSSRAAALVIRDSLKSHVIVLKMASGTLRPLRSLNTHQFQEPWRAHGLALARSLDPPSWETVASAFDGLMALTIMAEKRFDESSTPGATVAIDTMVAAAVKSAENAVRILESSFSLPETILPETIDRIETMAKISPEFAESLRNRPSGESSDS